MTPIGLDLAVRKIVMSSILYYGLDSPILSDADFDALCMRVVGDWHLLNPIHKWQLGSPKTLAATGFLIKATVASAAGAAEWEHISIRPTAPWKKHKDYGRWLNVGSFTYA